MHGADSVDLPSPRLPPAEGSAGTGAMPRQRRARASGSADQLDIIFDLSVDEPVTEAELRLIFAVLGDSIAVILDPAKATCPASTKFSAA